MTSGELSQHWMLCWQKRRDGNPRGKEGLFKLLDWAKNILILKKIDFFLEQLHYSKISRKYREFSHVPSDPTAQPPI